MQSIFGAITDAFLFANLFIDSHLFNPDAFQCLVMLGRHKRILHVLSNPAFPHLLQAPETGHVLTGRPPKEDR